MKSKKLSPLTRNSLQGVWSALIVPWTKTDRLDERRGVPAEDGPGQLAGQVAVRSS